MDQARCYWRSRLIIFALNPDRSTEHRHVAFRGAGESAADRAEVIPIRDRDVLQIGVRVIQFLSESGDFLSQPDFSAGGTGVRSVLVRMHRVEGEGAARALPHLANPLDVH
jgi:hypothetical protein